MCAGILDALRRCYGYDYKLFYRFGSYELFEMMPAHVFVVLVDQGREYWIDPVLSKFNQRSPAPIYFIDKKIPMSLVRLSGLSPADQMPKNYQSMGAARVGAGAGSSLYDAAAQKVGAALNKVVSNIPFVGLAQGILSSFFGPGGLSDWLSVNGILNEVKSALFGRKYTKGQYTMGERFRYYILGENIHTSDADVVTDEAVGTAMTTFSVGFGIPITTNEDLEALEQSADAYISRYVNYGGISANEINREAVNRAVLLKKTYFPGPASGNYAAAGPAPKKWNPADFNKIGYVIPIPDFTKTTIAEMWRSVYTGKIPGGDVKDGVVIAGDMTNTVPGGGPIKQGLTIGQWIGLGVGGFILYKLLVKK
jgi:hypothetical protein